MKELLIKCRNYPRFTRSVLFTLMVTSIVSLGAEPRYYLIDLGSLGGGQYADYFSGIENEMLSKDGTVVGGMGTSDADPFGWTDGLTSHAFEWKNGTLTDLTPVPFGDKGNFSQSFWVNDLGHSAGFVTYNASNPANGPLFKAALWKDGQTIELASLGGNQSFAQGINNLDQVVGWALDTVASSEKIWWDYPYPFGVQQRAALWENGTVRDLGTLGGPCSWAITLNDAGQVIGQSLTPVAEGDPKEINGGNWARPVAGFIWQNGVMTDLGNLGGTWVIPYRISRNGAVIGMATTEGDTSFHPFFWSQGVLQDLGTFGGKNGSAYAINDLGEVVGGATLANGNYRAFLWKNGVKQDLGSLRQNSQASHINSRSQIVGATGNGSQASNRAFLWENGGPMVDLNTLIPPGSGLTLRYSHGINDAGEILAYGVLENGDSHPALLLPMPTLSIRASSDAAGQNTVALEMKVSAGRKYVLESSRDLVSWTSAGEPFVATADTLTRERTPAEASLFFRLARIL